MVANTSRNLKGQCRCVTRRPAVIRVEHLRARRTRARSPQTNGVIERFFGSLKYERLYRHDIGNPGLVSS
jgi:transposase InsO family protein